MACCMSCENCALSTSGSTTSKTWNASSDGYRVQLPLTQVTR